MWVSFCAFWFWGSVGNHLHNAKLEVELLMLLVGCWLPWPGDYSWRWLTALLLERLLGVLALHWSSLNGAFCSVKPDEARELICLVPTTLPTCSYRLLHSGSHNISHEHPDCTARTQLVNWSHRLANRTPYIVSGWCRNSPRRLTRLLAVSHVFLCNSWRVITWPHLACHVTCKRQVCYMFTCCCIATETCGRVLFWVGYQYSQLVGGFHGMLPQ
jgi:hypothetical protein